MLGYDEASTILNAPETFASSNSIFGPGAGAIDAFPALISADGERHGRLRALTAKTLDAGAQERRWRALLRGFAGEQIASLPEGGFDVLRDLAEPLAWRAVLALVGVAPDRADATRADAQLVARGFGVPLASGDDGPSDDFRALARLRAVFASEIESRREAPRDDVLTRAMRARVEGRTFTRDELTATLIVIVAKGSVATTSLVTSAVRALAAGAGVFSRVRDDRTLIWNVLEETLRTEAPVQGIYRRATQDIEMGDARIKAGDALCVLFGAANRDDAYVDDAHAFSLDGARRDHLSFGRGLHYCPGSDVARAVAEEAVTALLDRFDGLEIGGADGARTHAGPLFLSAQSCSMRGARPDDAASGKPVGATGLA